MGRSGQPHRRDHPGEDHRSEDLLTAAEDQDEAAFHSAGSAAVLVNAPMSDQRLSEVVLTLTAEPPGAVADFGCGHGHLLVRTVAESPAARGVGIDVDVAALSAARRSAVEAGVAERTEFVECDAAAWTGSCDQALCVGSSHALGGPVPMLSHLSQIVPSGGLAVVGDGVWSRRPDRWHTKTFGALPDVRQLVEWAEMERWDVEDVDTSTLEEWDAFESAWSEGVRAVGTPAAEAFAERRRQEYRRYRGVLGFAWLLLRRT